MFKISRKLFIFINFSIVLFTFILVFFMRYYYNIFGYTKHKEINIFLIIIFTVYSLVYIIFSISMKIYEFYKLNSFTESIISLYISSILTSLFFAFFFYLTKFDFARFVFFLSLLIIPVEISLINKVIFYILYKNKIWNIYYIGNNFETFNNYISKIKYLNIKLSRIEINEILSIEKNDKTIVIIEKGNFTDKTKNSNSNINKSISNNSYSKNISESISKDILSENIPEEDIKLIDNFIFNNGKLVDINDFYYYFEQCININDINNFVISFFITDTFYNKYVKRFFDIIFSILFIVLTLPIQILIGIIIKLTSKGPILYKQNRVGLNNKIFTIYKFRSMYLNDNNSLTDQNDRRLTPFGKFLRQFRLDEIPQLYNILKGEMSFVGPRPEQPHIIEEILKFCPQFNKRLIVKPGLTGWAQVKYHYINNIENMKYKLSYDLYYIKNISFLFDLKIFLYTIETIIFRRGAI